MATQYLSAKQVAERLGVHARTARRYMRQMTRLVLAPDGAAAQTG